MTGSKPSSYYIPYYSGPVVDAKGNATPGFARYQLAVFNRTGQERGMDATYDLQQITLALKTANEAEADAHTAQSMAATAQGTASEALAAAKQATTAAQVAQIAAEKAEQDAQSAMMATEDVLIMTLLTSSSLTAKTAQSLDDAALMAAQSQIWPSQSLQSSRG